MREKVVVIRRCDDCPNFDNQYYTYNERCCELDRKIEYDFPRGYMIPSDCPLEDKKEE